MIRSLFLLDPLRWYTRLPLKGAILGFTILAVCFPYPRLTLRHIDHWLDPNALIRSDAPSLQPWVEELRTQLPTDLPPQDKLRLVEQFVYTKVPYEWDWVTWGLSDYLPTVEEVVTQGKEDCDGRAVIAASLLRHFGFQTRIVTDFAHVWVQTDKGETMGPGKRKAVTATDKGFQIDWGAFAQVPEVLAYGVAVFPWPREAIVLLVAWWLLLDRSAGRPRVVLSLLLFIAALLLMRIGGHDYWNPVRWMKGCGVITLAVTPLGLLLAGRRGKRLQQATADAARIG